MDYLVYKFIQASMYNEKYMDELKNMCAENFNATFNSINNFLEISKTKKTITPSSREKLYKLISYCRNDLEYNTPKDREMAYEILNDTIGLLNSIILGTELNLIKFETIKRYPENPFVQININEEFSNDVEIINNLASNKFNDKIINEYAMSDEFLASINAIVPEIKNALAVTFIGNVCEVLKENLRRCDNYKQYGIDECYASYIRRRTVNVSIIMHKKAKKEAKKITKINKKNKEKIIK